MRPARWAFGALLLVLKNLLESVAYGAASVPIYLATAADLELVR